MPGWTTKELGRLAAALVSFDKLEVARLTAEFITAVRSPVPPSPQEAVEVLKQLQRRLQLGPLEQVAEACLVGGIETTELVRRYALALLEAGQIAAAEGVLTRLPADVRRDDAEVAGAVSRVDKERYLRLRPGSGGARAAIAAAIDSYYRCYADDRSGRTYQGINALALLCRARRDEVKLADWPDLDSAIKDLGTEILATVAAQPQPQAWLCATAAEASLALDLHDDALGWLDHYLTLDLDAFEVNSTLRQFEQVWQLDERTAPGNSMVPLLKARLLQAQGGSIQLSLDEISPQRVDQLRTIDAALQESTEERVYSQAAIRPLYWLTQAQVAARSVGRVEACVEGLGGSTRIVGTALGSGFVIDGADVLPGRWPTRVLVTAKHVVPRLKVGGRAQIDFRGFVDSAAHLGDAYCLWAPDNADVRILALPEELASIPALRIRPPDEALEVGNDSRAYVIGYPLGSDLVHVSIDGAVLAEVYDSHIRYRSSTDKGNSGGPVFDNDWRVIGMHTNGLDTGNIGLRIDYLIALARAHYSAG